MPDCPRCHQIVDTTAVSCPHCHLVLKAYGHPGITLHRALGENYLCDTCTYHADDTCTFPQRPHAKECTLYQDQAKSLSETNNAKLGRNRTGVFTQIQSWLRQHTVWVVVLGLVIISFLVALF